MASFSRKTGIIGALVIAGVLVVGSLIFSNGGLAFFQPSAANAQSTQALLQAYAARDSDQDGLPDWQEALYGLDPNNAHSFSATVTDGEAVAQGLVQPKFIAQSSASSTLSATEPSVSDITTPAPGSLTEQFSQTLMSQYVNLHPDSSTQPSETEVATFAQSAMQTFARQHAQQDVYALGQIKIGGTGSDATKAYAATAEAIYGAHNPNTDKSEIEYFSDAIEKNDSSALAQVTIIGKNYSALAPALMQLKVPAEAQYAHLEISNAAYRLGADITDLSTMNTDPLRAYLGLAQYDADATALAKGFSDLGAVFSSEQITIPEGDPGYFLLRAATKPSQN